MPEGEVYVAVESPRGELGCYIASDGSAEAVPHAHAGAVVRQHPVPAAHDARPPRRRRRGDHLLASTRSSETSTDDADMRPRRLTDRGDVSRLTTPTCRRQGDHRALPAAEVGADPAAAPRPGAGRLRHQRGDGAHRRAHRRTRRPRCYGTATFYEMFKFEPVGKYLVNICGTMSCALLGADELMHHAEERLGIKAGGTTPDGAVHARARRVPGGLHRGAVPAGQLPLPLPGHAPSSSTSSSTTSPPARLDGEIPPHGTLARVRQRIPADRGVGAVRPRRRHRRRRRGCRRQPAARRERAPA